MQPLHAFASLSRFHIVFIATGGSLVFGWLLTGRFHPALAALVALDWFLVNLVNRVVDREEDRENGIRMTDFAHRHRRGIYVLTGLFYAAGFGVHLYWLPMLLVPRLLYHGLGLIYNFRLLPDGKGGRTRLKECFVLKNSASNLGFLLTLFAYPLFALPLRPETNFPYVLALLLYFAPFELSFEVIYDLRDTAGDRLAGVRSYPVVMGDVWSGRLIVLLNLFAIATGLFAAALGIFSFQEIILTLAPAFQLGLFFTGFRRGFRPADCIRLTWIFAAMLFGYVAWVGGGMPTELPFAVDLPLVIGLGLLGIGVLLWRWLREFYGDGRYARLYALIAFSGFLAEHSAIELYRFYSYHSSWRIFCGHVPLAVVLIWPMVILSAHRLMRRFGFSGRRAVVRGTLLVIAEAALIEVTCVQAELWWWEGTGVFGVPLIGMIGWGCFALGALWTVECLENRPWLLPPASLLSTHLLLQILWRGGFRWISYTELPEIAVLSAAGIVSAFFAFRAFRVRRRLDISLEEVFPRLLAAMLMYYILFASKAAIGPAIFALLFVPPYVILFRYRWIWPLTAPRHPENRLSESETVPN